MSLQAIPNETLLNILSVLSTPDLVNSSLVSQRFYNLVQIPLYRHLALPHPAVPARASSLALLLRTLFTHSTREIPTRNTRSLFVYDGTDDDYPVPFGRRLIQLLSLMPRLELFEIWPWAHSHQALFDCLHTPSVMPVALHNLREFRSTNCELGDGLSIHLLTRLMALPSLRTLVITVDDDTSVSLDTAYQFTSGITTLELVDCHFTHEWLAVILKIPRSLSSFIYRQLPDFSFHLEELGKALQPLHGSLEHLDLDFTQLWLEDIIEDDDRPIGSFRDWHCLKSLDIPLEVLLGIPTCTLCFLQDYGHFGSGTTATR
ncbi:hypothetical protein Q9L58_010543 [Maublancomyces gigas]|uniref:F-box domain-containing protein n=1 Tax=Discina gigas TaxID=1032678 RepID=A0ABR3G3U0_9PEZI